MSGVRECSRCRHRPHIGVCGYLPDDEVEPYRCRCPLSTRPAVPLSTVSAADLLDPEPILPIEPTMPTRPSTLKGRAIPYRPAAPVVQGADGLRSAIARLLCVHYAGVIDEELPVADEILALPELARLLAERDQAQATLERVRAAVDRHADNLSRTQRAAFARALDGDQ